MRVIPKFFEVRKEAAAIDLLSDLSDDIYLLERVLRRLPKEERNVIKARYGYNRKPYHLPTRKLIPYSLLAIRFGKTKEAVKQQCWRTLRKLRRLYFSLRK